MAQRKSYNWTPRQRLKLAIINMLNKLKETMSKELKIIMIRLSYQTI